MHKQNKKRHNQVLGGTSVCTMIPHRTGKKKEGTKNYRKFQGNRKGKKMFFGVLCLDAFHCVVIIGSPLILSFFLVDCRH